jgi:hypothetical protein
MCIADFLKGYDVVTQHNIVEKTLSHEIITSMVFSYLQDPMLLKHGKQLIENFKVGLSSHVTSQWPSKLVMAKDIVYTFASSQMGSNKGVARALGVDRKNIKKGCE